MSIKTDYAMCFKSELKVAVQKKIIRYRDYMFHIPLLLHAPNSVLLEKKWPDVFSKYIS